MRVVILTNMPAPYRVPVHEMVSEYFNGEFLVIYSAQLEPNRAWDFGTLKFDHLYLKENVKVKSDGYNYVHNNLDVFKHLRAFNPDVIITTSYNPTHLYAWFYALIFRKKHIPMTDGWEGGERFLSSVHRLVRKVVFRTSSAFIGASKNSLALFKSYGVDENKLFQSHLCVENSRFENSNSFDDRAYDLMFSGRITEWKGALFFAEVAKKVAENLPNLKVLILGDGELREELLERLESLGIEYNYAGFVAQKDLPQYYSNSKIFLFPTKLDAWGVVVNESMASGTPVVSTPYAGVINDLVLEEENGYIVEMDSTEWSNRVTSLLLDREKWETFSRNSKSRVEEFTFENSANGIISASEYACKS
jgi:glycosyltransferase involved in cell wall biosynthesis